MKKSFLCVIVSLLSITLSAQIKVINIKTEADTLVYSTLRGNTPEDTIELYKNQSGYLIRNGKDLFKEKKLLKFCLGTNKHQAMESLKDLCELSQNDIDTQFIIEDCSGTKFYGTTVSESVKKRVTTYREGDRVLITTGNISDTCIFKRVALEEIIKFLRK